MSFDLFQDWFGAVTSIYWVVQMVVLSVLVLVITGYIIMKFILWKRRGRCTCDVDLTGKTVIITGANSGIGYETAMNLARRHARVIVACRDPAAGDDAVKNLIQDTGNTNICFHKLDMASFKSIKAFATTIRTKESQLDILINNAGITGLPYRLSEDKLEYTFHTNYAGPFLLTNLLLDLLKKSAPSRIVNVSSIAHKWGHIDFSNLNSEQHFHTGKAYFNSKLALVMFTRELARHLEGTGVAVCSLHPGTVNTQLLRNLPFLLRKLFHIVGFLFFKDATEGVQTTIHCAVSDKIVDLSGCYFSECRVASEASAALDEPTCRKLWETTEGMVFLAEAESEVENNIVRSRSQLRGDRKTIRTHYEIVSSQVEITSSLDGAGTNRTEQNRINAKETLVTEQRVTLPEDNPCDEVTAGEPAYDTDRPGYKTTAL